MNILLEKVDRNFRCSQNKKLLKNNGHNVSMDTEKAFDLLQHIFLILTLKKKDFDHIASWLESFLVINLFGGLKAS